MKPKNCQHVYEAEINTFRSSLCHSHIITEQLAKYDYGIFESQPNQTCLTACKFRNLFNLPQTEFISR